MCKVRTGRSVGNEEKESHYPRGGASICKGQVVGGKVVALGCSKQGVCGPAEQSAGGAWV